MAFGSAWNSGYNDFSACDGVRNLEELPHCAEPNTLNLDRRLGGE